MIYFLNSKELYTIFENGNHSYKFNFKIFTSQKPGEFSGEPLLILSSFLSDALE